MLLRGDFLAAGLFHVSNFKSAC